MHISPVTPKGRSLRQSAIARNLADLPTDCTSLEQLLEEAEPHEWASGLTWYSRAHNWALSLANAYNLPTYAVTAITAICSPQKEWGRNRQIVETILASNNPDNPEITANQADKVRSILSNPISDPSPHLGQVARKVRSFYHNLTYPFDSYHVTLDRHAEAAFFGHPAHTSHLARIGAYHVIAGHFRHLARKHTLYPHQVQAIIWEVWKNRHSYTYLANEEAF